MNPLWTARAIASATGGTASADFPVQGVAFDSREVRQGDLFIAMQGEATDGHNFLDQAIAAGAERKSGGYGKSVSGRVDLDGRRIIKQKTPKSTYPTRLRRT